MVNKIFLSSPRAIQSGCQEVAGAYVHLRVPLRFTHIQKGTVFVLCTVLLTCGESFLPIPLILSARGAKLSTSKDQDTSLKEVTTIPLNTKWGMPLSDHRF